MECDDPFENVNTTLERTYFHFRTRVGSICFKSPESFLICVLGVLCPKSTHFCKKKKQFKRNGFSIVYPLGSDLFDKPPHFIVWITSNMKFIVLNVKMDVLLCAFFLRTMNSWMFSFKEENKRKKRNCWSTSVSDECAFFAFNLESNVDMGQIPRQRTPRILQ